MWLWMCPAEGSSITRVAAILSRQTRAPPAPPPPGPAVSRVRAPFARTGIQYWPVAAMQEASPKQLFSRHSKYEGSGGHRPRTKTHGSVHAGAAYDIHTRSPPPPAPAAPRPAHVRVGHHASGIHLRCAARGCGTGSVTNRCCEQQQSIAKERESVLKL